MENKITKEVYKSQIEALDEKISELLITKGELRRSFLKDNAEFSVGDKVVVVWDKKTWLGREIPEKRLECFISSVNDKYYYGSVNYGFHKVKKDGTESNQSAGYISSWDRIELIQKAKIIEL